MLFTFKKQRKFMLFLLIAFVSIFSVSCTSNSSNSEPEEIPEDILYIKTEEFTAKYLRHEVLRNYHYRDQLVVYFEFTNNNAPRSNSFAYAFWREASQNGTRLNDSYDELKDIPDNSTLNIRRGKTTEVYVMYYLKDNSDVELKLWDGYYEDSMILSIE